MSFWTVGFDALGGRLKLAFSKVCVQRSQSPTHRVHKHALRESLQINDQYSLIIKNKNEKNSLFALRSCWTMCSAWHFWRREWCFIPSRSLRSASERRLVVPSQRGSKSLSRTFSFTIPGWWNDLPTPIRNAGSLSIFKQQLKTHLFQHYLTSSS